MGFLEELQPPILANSGSWRRVQEWLTGSEAVLPWDSWELCTSAEPLHSPEDEKQNQAAAARPWGQVAFSTGNHTLGLITGFLTKDSARDFP